MTVKWKNNKNLKPEVLLKRINSIKTTNEHGSLSYPVFDFNESMAALFNMVEFPKTLVGLNHEEIVGAAVHNIAKKDVLDEKKVINEINAIVKKQLARKERTFYILTSLSLAKPFPFKSFNIENCNIKILAKEYAKKYKNRNAVLATRYLSDTTPFNYSKIIVKVDAKSEASAMTLALRSIDLLRSVMNFMYNSKISLFNNNDWSPINKVRLGRIHSIHVEDGSIATDTFWFEPGFVAAKKLFECDKNSQLLKRMRLTFKKIDQLAYGDKIKDALLRYVRALDECDPNVALIRLWSALEDLLLPSGSNNNDKITQRLSYLYSERDYHKQILEHLREYRNRNVHVGSQSESAKTNCYLLQNYFRDLIRFHLSYSGSFKDLDETNFFLDLLSDKDVLQNKQQLIKKAILFLSPRNGTD